MDLIFSIAKYIFVGFFGLIGVLFLLALVFGKRVVTQWEFEAEFQDESGKEFGEFDIELSRVAKKETEDTFKAKFRLRHETLKFGQRVQVYLDEALVLEGSVEKAGRILLTDEHIQSALTTANSGQICKVVYGGTVQFSQAIEEDQAEV